MILGLFPAAAFAASAAPASTLNIQFDGYCDGMSLTTPSAGLGSRETVDGDQTGCVTGGIFGTTSAFKDQYFMTVPTYGTFTVVGMNHTWVHYALQGNQIYVLNNGTWSPGTPKAAPGTASSFARPATVTESSVPANTFDIMFDGYCDGFELNSPSAGLGYQGTVDGNRIGCAADGLMGASTRLHSDGAIAVGYYADGTTWIETVVMLSGTWIHFSVSGDLIYILNSGTWSYGTTPTGTHRSTG
jgi:hypothetical protein